MTTYFTQHPQGDKTMTLELERHLMEMGVIASTMLEELESHKAIIDPTMVKGYFNDPRDANGEVPF